VPRFLLPLLVVASSACASQPPPAHVQRERVTPHFVVVVQEPDPLAVEAVRDHTLLTRSVAGGPLSFTSRDETAFATEDPRYTVRVAWREKCLDVVVARSGLAPFDDFAAHGCVKLDGPSTTVASVTGNKGTPIEVLVWVLET
jgi:hypothetical protein